MTPHLTLVDPDPISRQIHALEQQLAALGRQQAEAFVASLEDALRTAEELVANTNAPVGIREIANRTTKALRETVLTSRAILGRKH